MDAVDLSAFKNNQRLACYEAELKRQDAVLHDTYKKVRTAADSRALLMLMMMMMTGQKACLAYREGWCQLEESTTNAPGGAVNYVACLMELTIAQIARLKDSGGG